MPGPATLLEAIIILVAAVAGVVLLQRLRLGPILGYLAAGLAIGPAGLGLVQDPEAIAGLAEFGVVFLLFAVGLELPMERIKVMPAGILWLGTAQILVTGLLVWLGAVVVGAGAPAAFAIAAALTLSSTAIVLRLLSDARELSTRFARAAFGVLILQDLAVGPLIILVLSFGAGEGGQALGLGLSLLKAAAFAAAMLLGGRYAVRPLFTAVAATKTPEIFAALTLLVVLAAALASESLGLSMGLGALLAGIMLAESPYRHQVGAEIAPFRGLLLGLFFMTIGMSFDVEYFSHRLATTALLALGLMTGKAAIMIALAWWLHLPPAQALRFGLLLSQGGEFAFVLLAAAAGENLVSDGDRQLLTAAVVLTMMLTPLAAFAGRRLEAAAMRVLQARGMLGAPDEAELDRLGGHVIIAGFGRIGRAVSRQLSESGLTWVAIDSDTACVKEARAAGLPVYFGDAWRLDALESLHVDRARAVVVTVNSPRAALQLVATLHYVLPGMPIMARAYDEAHAEELRLAGAEDIVLEGTPVGDRLADFARAAFRSKDGGAA